MEEIAAILGVTPEFLAFNVHANREKIVCRSPERENVVWISETTFGETAEDRTEGEKFGFPGDYLRRDLRANPETCILVHVTTHAVEPHFEYGDRVIVDTSDVRPSPGGVFLYWDGLGAALAIMHVIPQRTRRWCGSRPRASRPSSFRSKRCISSAASRGGCSAREGPRPDLSAAQLR